jgi:hypothetical protein
VTFLEFQKEWGTRVKLHFLGFLECGCRDIPHLGVGV